MSKKVIDDTERKTLRKTVDIVLLRKSTHPVISNQDLDRLLNTIDALKAKMAEAEREDGGLPRYVDVDRTIPLLARVWCNFKAGVVEGTFCGMANSRRAIVRFDEPVPVDSSNTIYKDELEPVISVLFHTREAALAAKDTDND